MLTDIPKEWAQKDGSAVRVDQHQSKVLKLKSVSGSQKFSVLGKVIKCALSLSHGNADNERSLSINKNTLSKERSSLSITALNISQSFCEECPNTKIALLLHPTAFHIIQCLPS